MMHTTPCRSLHPASLDVLLSSEVIAVNQDALGVPADLIWKQAALEVYAGPLEGAARVAVLFNRLNTDSQYPTTNITLLWVQLGIEPTTQCAVRYAVSCCHSVTLLQCRLLLYHRTGTCIGGVTWVAFRLGSGSQWACAMWWCCGWTAAGLGWMHRGGRGRSLQPACTGADARCGLTDHDARCCRRTDLEDVAYVPLETLPQRHQQWVQPGRRVQRGADSE